VRAGMPEPALAILGDVAVVSYEQMTARVKPALNSRNKVDEIRLANELANRFRAQYREAGEVARGLRAAR
jgi:iron(III) transport system substrate-binding protein